MRRWLAIIALILVVAVASLAPAAAAGKPSDFPGARTSSGPIWPPPTTD